MSKPVIGQCDCCGADNKILHERWPSGMETWACAECCHIEEEDDAEGEWYHGLHPMHTENP